MSPKLKIKDYYVKASDGKKIYGSFTFIIEELALEVKHCHFIYNRSSKSVMIDSPYKIVRDEEEQQVKVPVLNFLNKDQNTTFRQNLQAVAKEFFSSITVQNTILRLAEHKKPPEKKGKAKIPFKKNPDRVKPSNIKTYEKTSWKSKI